MTARAMAGATAMLATAGLALGTGGIAGAQGRLGDQLRDGAPGAFLAQGDDAQPQDGAPGEVICLLDARWAGTGVFHGAPQAARAGRHRSPSDACRGDWRANGESERRHGAGAEANGGHRPNRETPGPTVPPPSSSSTTTTTTTATARPTSTTTTTATSAPTTTTTTTRPATTTTTTAGTAAVDVATLVSDMTLPNEGHYHGVPLEWDWAQGPTSFQEGFGKWPALTGWGQVYEAAEGNPSTNTQVELRDMTTWALSKRTGTWRIVQHSTDVEGGAWKEDFSAELPGPGSVPLADGGVGVHPGGGANFHFWPSTGRAAIDPADLAAVVVTFRARLVLANPSGPDDRAAARFLAAAGGDWWSAVDGDSFNDGIGVGRAKYVRSDWQTFSFHTLSPDALRANPPR